MISPARRDALKVAAWALAGVSAAARDLVEIEDTDHLSLFASAGEQST